MSNQKETELNMLH